MCFSRCVQDVVNQPRVREVPESPDLAPLLRSIGLKGAAKNTALSDMSAARHVIYCRILLTFCYT